MDEILQELTPVMKKEFPRRPPTNENLYSYYMTRVKWNLHVALCFSPVIKLNSKHSRNHYQSVIILCYIQSSVLGTVRNKFAIYTGRKFWSIRYVLRSATEPIGLVITRCQMAHCGSQ